MAVKKFATFEDARRDLWTEPGDPSLLERMKRLGSIARTSPAFRGVKRFRSIEDAKSSRSPAEVVHSETN